MGLVRQAKFAFMRRLGRTIGLPGLDARLRQLEMRGPIADARLDQCEQAVPAAMRAQRIANDLEKRADLHFQQLFDIVERAAKRQIAYAEAAEARFADLTGRLESMSRSMEGVKAGLDGAAERIDAAVDGLQRADERIVALDAHLCRTAEQLAARGEALESVMGERLAAVDTGLSAVRGAVDAMSAQIAGGASEVAEIGLRVAELGDRLDDGFRSLGSIAAAIAQSEARLEIGEDAVGRMSARLDGNDAMIGRMEVAVGRLREESEVCRSMVETIRQWIDAVDEAANGEDRKQALLRLRAHVSDLEARMNLFHGERINLIRHFLFGAAEDRVQGFVPFSSLEES